MARRQGFTPDYHQRRRDQREDHMWKEDMRAHQQADKIRYGVQEKVHAETERARKDLDAATKGFERDAAEAVKRILSTPITQWTGGARGPVPVTYRGEPILTLNADGNGKGKPEPTADPAVLDEVRRSYPRLPNLAVNPKAATFFSRCGLTIDSTETATTDGGYGPVDRKVTTRHVPSLTAVAVQASGLELTYAHRGGDSAKAWVAKLDVLRAGFRATGIDATNLSVQETKNGDIRLVFDDRDPFEALAQMDTGTWDDVNFRSLLGIDRSGREVWVTWKNSSGMIVGGMGGCGKTASMLPIFRGMEGHAELFIFDGKAQRDLHPLRHICRHYDNSGSMDAPLETLEMLERLRVMRGDALYEKLKEPNFWNVAKAKRDQLGMKPIFVVLDEAQVWLKPPVDKEKKAISARISECVENLIRMGRSAGIVVIITTQRPSAESVPTDLRDNAQLKLCFRVINDISATMVLGHCPQGVLNPVGIPASARGRFVMDTEGSGMVLGQAGYISPDDLEQILKNSAPVEDQWALAERFAGGARGGSPKPSPAPKSKPAPTPPTPPTPPVHGMTQAERDEAIRQEAIRLGYLTPDDEPADGNDKQKPARKRNADGSTGADF
ncbi:hypothetical protein [Mycolicibacter arupensis]|uniref:FtsK domain-containing protein n=1 Tax=Mycolicibacter arupensis TaxID=342002 RepID=A0A5C7Y404_9MYCO|nr:hypothetical protein [Mycolicibacter arupensis]TXI55914.1 MAG: hypothetical protein E6Q54_11850 [Mycolicibacter arupensis]